MKHLRTNSLRHSWHSRDLSVCSNLIGYVAECGRVRPNPAGFDWLRLGLSARPRWPQRLYITPLIGGGSVTHLGY